MGGRAAAANPTTLGCTIPAPPPAHTTPAALPQRAIIQCSGAQCGGPVSCAGNRSQRPADITPSPQPASTHHLPRRPPSALLPPPPDAACRPRPSAGVVRVAAPATPDPSPANPTRRPPHPLYGPPRNSLLSLFWEQSKRDLGFYFLYLSLKSTAAWELVDEQHWRSWGC